MHGALVLLRNVLYTLGAPSRRTCSNSTHVPYITDQTPQISGSTISTIWVTKHFRSMVCSTPIQPHANAALILVTDGAVNNANAQIAITVRGSDWYWTVCAIMIAATFAFVGLATTKPRQQRIFHYITASITMVAAIAYFSMASNLGWTGIAVEFVRSDPKVAGLYREIFYGELHLNINLWRWQHTNGSQSATSTGSSPLLFCSPTCFSPLACPGLPFSSLSSLTRS